ncbi:sensor histidine kinase [Streptomyces sp. HUAS TT7]|uniref:sensor histidine kinase n=1 Tax=Streptomyces sp. HUAS TT7 TaxID=3447507 RepID=UPI003F656C6E
MSAASLITLVFVAAAIDARSASRSRDAQVSGRAQALSRAVWMDGGVLHLEPLSEDDLASGSAVTAVLRRVGTGPVEVRWVRPSPGVLPPTAELDVLWQNTVRTQDTVLATLTGAEGRRLRWAAAPVWGADEIGAVVLAATELEPERNNHAELLRWLTAGCAVLTLAAAGAGHVLSGRSMRPALRALDQQEQFLAEAAHELRTPLAVLRLAVEDSTASPRASSARPDVVRLVDHLDRLVAGLLSRARIEAGSRHLERTPLRLDQLVEQVVDELPHDSAHITVRTEPTIVLGDPDLLAQAVRNLVENALRHGKAADGPSSVDVYVAAGKISVRDCGPGIAAEEREKVFGNRMTGGRGGIGVGLAIVRWVAELHGGTADAVESAEAGALVELVLPEHSPT